MRSRRGSPKEMFDTPRLVLTPSFSRTRRKALSVVTALRASELTVMQSTSMTMSFFGIP